MRRNSAWVGVAIGAIVAIMVLSAVLWSCAQGNGGTGDSHQHPEETVYRDDGGLVTTIDVQGRDVVFVPVGEFTDAVVQLSGPWSLREAPDAYNGLCAWASASQPREENTRGADLSLAYIKPSLPVAGRYNVSAWWCEPKVGNLDRALEIRIHAKAGEVYQWTLVDLRERPGEWQDLGTFYLEPDGEVTISNWNGAVTLDAIRFVYLDDVREMATAPVPMPPPPLPSPTPTSER